MASGKVSISQAAYMLIRMLWSYASCFGEVGFPMSPGGRSFSCQLWLSGCHLANRIPLDSRGVGWN